jgi:hypothetical protein
MSASLPDYIKAAFNARPFGMPVPPNWLGLAAFAMLGLLNPGFWLLGAGLEAAYLLTLSHLPRFRAIVDGTFLGEKRQRADQETEAILAKLAPERHNRFAKLRTRCEHILEQQKLDSAVRQIQAAGLSRLLAIYLRLLVTQELMQKLLLDNESDSESLGEALDELRKSLAAENLAPEHRRSLEGQLEIVTKRQNALNEGEERLAFTESEITRIEQQVALIRDEVRLSAAPESIGSQIDRVSGELSETSQWISDQQPLFGGEDLDDDTIGIVLDHRETQ